MHHPLSLISLCLIALSLGACDRTPPEPQLSPASSDSVAQAASAPLVSVPPAESVLATPATAAKTDPTAGRSNSPMSRAQESSAMPMPGQNNDHSAPLNPPKPASGPDRR
jgi:hypothetical protein